MTDQIDMNGHPKKKAFLDVFRRGGTVIAACEQVEISRQSVYKWRKEDPDFEIAFLEAEAENTEHLEQIAEELARPHDASTEEYGIVTDRRGNAVLDADGNPRMVLLKRNQKTTYDTTLLIFLLKGRLPEKYRELRENRLTGGIDVKMTSIDEALARMDAGEDTEHSSTHGESGGRNVEANDEKSLDDGAEGA